MEEEKVFQRTVENELMSLAHEILRHRKRMQLSDIHDKAAAIVALTTPNKEIANAAIPKGQAAPTALEEVLLEPMTEIAFEAVPVNFVETLFEGNNTDYQRIISMLNSKENAAQAKAFIEEQVRPDYDWSSKESEVVAFIEYISSLYEV